MDNTRFLYSNISGKVAETQKLSVRDMVIHSLEHKGDIPAFPATARKLKELLKQPDIDMESIAEVVKLDPGIASRFLRLASSPMFGGQKITNILDALVILGLNEVQKAATTFAIVDSFAHLNIRVNWELFWLHSLLTARLTECLVNAYREPDGKGYLAGLLHDIGKLFLEHYFRKEFEMVVIRAMATQRSLYDAEKKLFDITHAEVSSMLCHKWQLDEEVVRSIRFHHEPTSIHNKASDNSESQHFLAICIYLADQLANICHANIQGGENTPVEFTSLPEWNYLKDSFVPRRTLVLDVETELQKAQEIISSLKSVSRHK